jgi:hypothetical protein
VNYNFKVNGSSLQNGSGNSYTNAALTDGATVTCDITVAGGMCLTSTTATSNTITMIVHPILTPAVTIVASPSGTICSGTSVTFTATATNTGGGSIVYDFKVDGISQQIGLVNTYNNPSLTDGNSVTCNILISGGTCLDQTTATSNTLLIAVDSNLTPTVSIVSSQGSSICSGTSVTYTASASNTGDGTINYDFKVNGISQQSGPENTYSNTSLIDSDIVTCEITVTGSTCLSSITATSNIISMVVHQPPATSEITTE